MRDLLAKKGGGDGKGGGGDKGGGGGKADLGADDTPANIELRIVKGKSKTGVNAVEAVGLTSVLLSSADQVPTYPTSHSTTRIWLRLLGGGGAGGGPAGAVIYY